MINLKSIPYAYSLELKEILSADDAYDFFWAGKLVDKRKFKCPDPKCQATYTCANMDKEETELLQIPHFRITGEHDEGCSLLKLPSEIPAKTSTSVSSEASPGQFLEIGEFVLVRPEPSSREQHINENAQSYQYISSVGEQQIVYSPNRKFYSIRPLVERFFDLRETGRLDLATIKVDGRTFPLKYLFKGIFNQDIDEHQEYPHIYWGPAYINAWNAENFRISFNSRFLHDSELIRPSFFVTRNQLDSHQSGRRLSRYLSQKSIDEKTAFITFIYGIPTYKQSKGKNYVNFDLDNLDYLDFRTTDYYEKLRRGGDFSGNSEN